MAEVSKRISSRKGGFNRQTLTWVESLEPRQLLSTDPAIAAYQARGSQVLQSNVDSILSWASTHSGETDNIATGGLSMWTAAAAFTQYPVTPSIVAAGFLLGASLMEAHVNDLYAGGNDGWDAWATADTYLRYRSIIQTDTTRYTPANYAVNPNAADGKYSLDDLYKIVLTQSYYAPIDSTSNHYLMNATACYLANQAFPGQVVKAFNNSTTDPIGANHIYSRAQGIATSGPGEFLSINYGVANWGEFLSIYQLTQLSTNAREMKASKLAFETALAMNAGYWMNGQVAGPTGRGYPNTGAWGAASGDELTWVYLGGDYGQPAQQLAYATSTNVKAFAVLASEAGITLSHSGAPTAYLPPANILHVDDASTAKIIKSNFNGDFQYAYDNGLWSTYSDGYNWEAQGGAAWRNRTIWTKPESQTYNAVAWAINPGTSATTDANGNWTYVNPDTLQTYPLSGSGTYGGGSPFSSQVQNQGTVLQGFNIPPRSAGITPGGSYVVRGALIYTPIPKVTATGLEAADGDGWIRPVISTDGHRLFVAYNSVFMCFLSTAPISVGTKLGFMQFYNIFGGALPGQTVDPETYLQFAIAQETFSPGDFAGTTLAEQFANFQTVMNGRALPAPVKSDTWHPSWKYADDKVTLTTEYGSPDRYARDPETYTRGFGDDYIADAANSNPQIIDYSTWPLFQVADTTGKTYVNLPESGANMTVAVPGQSTAYYDFTNWTTPSGADLGLQISSPAGGQIRLNWNTGLGASSFKIERSSDSVTWTMLTSSLSGSVSSYTDSGLTQRSIYYYRVTPNGTSLGTSFPVSAMTTYNAPSNLQLTLNSTSQISFTWSNSAVNNDSVQLQYSIDGYSQWAWVVNLPASYASRTVSYTDFTGGERLFYRALAYSNDGPNGTYLFSPASNVVGTEFSSAYVGGNTSMPRFLRAAANASGTQIALSWQDTAYNETAYRVQRSSDTGATWTTLTSTLPANTTSYTDSGFPAGATYTYRVAAINGSSAGAWSQWASARAVAANTLPAIAQAATASPTSVSGTTTALSVLGSDDAGETPLRYFWRVFSGPGAVAFSDNYANSSKNTTATFSRAGAYVLKVIVVDAQGASASSTVTVNVLQTPTNITLSPKAMTLSVSSTYSFSASVIDQFGWPINLPITWSTTAGTISSAGLLTTSSTPGMAIVTASMGAISTSATVNVLNIPRPLAYYRFDEGTGTTTADASGNGYTGALTGGSAFAAQGITTNGLPSSAMNFAGDGNVNLGNPSTLNFTGAITLCAWVKFTGTSGLQYIIGHSYTTSPSAEVFLRLNGASYQVGSWDGGNHYTSSTIPAGDLNQWVFLTGVYDPAQSKWLLYRNGAVASSVTSTIGALQVNKNWTIGSHDGTGRYLTGSVDEVRIFNVAMSSNEITNLYRSYIAPTVASPAVVTSMGVTTASLSVLGATAAGESTLKYTWSTVGTPPAPVTFSANGANAAKMTIASFTRTGSCVLRATITDANGLSVSSDVAVNVTFGFTGVNGDFYFDYAAPKFTLVTKSGVVTVAADLGANGRTVSIQQLAGTTCMVQASQRLDSLVIAGGAKTQVASIAASVLELNNLTIASSSGQPTGLLDITSHALILHSIGALAGVVNLIRAGKNGWDNNGMVNWNGQGIISSTARANNLSRSIEMYGVGAIRNGDLGFAAYSSFASRSVGTNDVLVRFTYLGDADLDGSITISDYVAIDSTYGGTAGNLGWVSGDFDFDQSITISDYVMIDTTYAFGTGPILLV